MKPRAPSKDQRHGWATHGRNQKCGLRKVQGKSQESARFHNSQSPVPQTSVTEQTQLRGSSGLGLRQLHRGTFGPMVLAQLGANVIKVESLQGRRISVLRVWFPGLESGQTRAVDRPQHLKGERRCTTWYAKRMSSWKIYDQAPRSAMASTTRRFRASIPQLIYATVTAFGSSGPDHDQPGFDPSCSHAPASCAPRAATAIRLFI